MSTMYSRSSVNIILFNFVSINIDEMPRERNFGFYHLDYGKVAFIIHRFVEYHRTY